MSPQKSSILFEELKPEELKKIIDNPSIIYLPLGTLEWHSDHLPFGTDAFESYEICKAVCKKTGGCVIPPLYFGTDREHKIKGKLLHGIDARAGKILPGSIYFLEKDLFYKIIKKIANNVTDQGFKKLVIISAHSGTAQQDAIECLAKEKIGNLQILVFPGKKFSGGIDHAGKLETGLMLAVKPDLVDLSGLHKLNEIIIGGNPKLANKEDGQTHFAKIVNEIANKVLS